MPGAWASGIFALDCQYDRIVQEMDRICLGNGRQDVYNRQKIKTDLPREVLKNGEKMVA